MKILQSNIEIKESKKARKKSKPTFYIDKKGVKRERIHTTK